MSNEVFVNLLKQLKKANQASKLKLAQKNGYSTIEDYQNYLDGMILGKSSKKTSKEKPIVHVVDILDASGSMAGSKISNANQGIKTGIEKLRDEKNVNHTYTFVHFSDSNDIKTPIFMEKLNNVKYSYIKDRNSTALYQAVGTTLNKLVEKVKDGEKVLVNIYTDGGENDSKIPYTANYVSNLIENLKSKGYTVTFIGTDRDVLNVINKLNIDESNTLKYNGSADGLKMSMTATFNARTAYSANVAKGEDVSKGFYSKRTGTL